MWQVDQPDRPPVVLHGHQKEVTAVCWSPALTEVCATRHHVMASTLCVAHNVT